jgi:hypothetical protein
VDLPLANPEINIVYDSEVSTSARAAVAQIERDQLIERTTPE